MAIGVNVLKENTSGTGNTAIGSNNLRQVTTGNNNTAIGKNVGQNITTGINNTFIGSTAGQNAAATATGNVFLGYGAGANEAGSNLLYINNGPASTPLIYGDFAAEQVAIGTTTLADGYSLSVGGKGIFTEVRVLEVVNWPDYVFQSNYDLKSIEEVESFINDNGHLPNIPSASTVEEEGFLLGDMNKNLLEKVEELTLYMIDMNKKVKNLQEENKELKKELEQLKK